MKLPIPLLPAGTLTLPGGERIEYHSLSRAEALALNDYQGRESEAEDWMIASAIDVSIEEAHAWRDAVSLEIGQLLVDAIVDISGLRLNGNGTHPKARTTRKRS